jgi:hypothetical protein
LVARTAPVRAVLGDDRRLSLLLWMGASSLAALLKTQASHYAFPAAVCLLTFAAIVFAAWSHPIHAGPRFVGALAIVVVLIVLSGLAYRPAALVRLTRLQSFEDEAAAAVIAANSPRDGTAIFLDRSTWLYWLTGRAPAWPVVNTDVQTTYLVGRDPAPMLAALDDPRLQLVVYDPSTSPFEDPHFLDGPAQRHLLSALTCRLAQQFDRHDAVAPSLVAWTRRAAALSGKTRDCSN